MSQELTRHRCWMVATRNRRADSQAGRFGVFARYPLLVLECNLQCDSEHHFTAYEHEHEGKGKDLGSLKNPGGIKACSRWSSEATPPVSRPPVPRIPKGCQQRLKQHVAPKLTVRAFHFLTIDSVPTKPLR
jgi:hypothetical protein